VEEGKLPAQRGALRRWASARAQPWQGAMEATSFRYYQYGERVVHLDGCVEVEAAYYSVAVLR
jgi:hypothetical protein